jgi:hypothetical protein
MVPDPLARTMTYYADNHDDVSFATKANHINELVPTEIGLHKTNRMLALKA